VQDIPVRRDHKRDGKKAPLLLCLSSNDKFLPIPAGQKEGMEAAGARRMGATSAALQQI
jgi:hypothetical protein